MELYKSYPTETIVKGITYPVCTDFRDWIMLMQLTKDPDLTMIEKVALYTQWYKSGYPEDIKDMVDGLIRFMNNEQEGEEKKNKPKQKKKVFDFVHDADYVMAGFLQAYGIDLMALDYMHWYKFLSLFRGLPSDTEIMQRIKYRSIDPGKIQNREERARIRRIQLDIDLPQEVMTDGEIGNAFML